MSRRDAITQSNQSGQKKKQALLGLGAMKPEAAIAWQTWWGRDGMRAVDVVGVPDADLMLGRLDPFPADLVQSFPRFKDPTTPIRMGTSLCRLGFPFNSVEASYAAAADQFMITKMEVPYFPIEGILTRQLEKSRSSSGYMNGFIETSSPGLMGQSGGPIFDASGAVWGIQSQTQSLSLGFAPEVKDPANPTAPGKREHQFLNVGWCTHPATIVGLLTERNIPFSMAP